MSRLGKPVSSQRALETDTDKDTHKLQHTHQIHVHTCAKRQTEGGIKDFAESPHLSLSCLYFCHKVQGSKTESCSAPRL